MNDLAPTVSIIIPTKNSVRYLENLFTSIRKQTYRQIETIVVDGHSTDGTIELAERYGARVIQYDSGVPDGKFDAPHRRNYGVRMSVGRYVYYVDADMELESDLVAEAVELCQSGASAVIIAEQSFGSGLWARAKTLERLTYMGDDMIEAPRFLDRRVWEDLGGLDEELGGGGDDWDLHEALKKAGHLISRTKSRVMHNEGNLQLMRLLKKRYMYGQDSWSYIRKRPRAAIHAYFPLRWSYFRNWRLFLKNPIAAFIMIFMRVCEYCAGLAGVSVGILRTRGWKSSDLQ